jgi:hypothetical protein
MGGHVPPRRCSRAVTPCPCPSPRRSPVSLIRAVTTGSLIGVATAVGIFVAAGPDDLGRAAAPAAPTFAPVPTPTVTELADCEKPAVLKKGVCVTTKPGPRITVAAPAGGGSTTSAPRTAPRTAPAPAPASTHQDQEPADDHGDDEHDDDREADDHDDD